MLKPILLFIVLSVLIMVSDSNATVQAQAILTPISEINFGQIIIEDQNMNSSVQISPNGGFIASPSLLFARDPAPGFYRVDNVPQGTPISLVISDTVLTSELNPADPVMTITNYVTSPPSLVSGPGDFVEFSLGATIGLLGSGSVYTQSQFSTVIDIDVSY